MKIVIVGGGAIGRLLGSYLGKGGNQITLVDIDPLIVEEIKAKGIGLMVHDGDHPSSANYIPADATTDPSTIQECDLILLTVKSFATRAAVESVAHLVSENSPILFMQTGLGNQAILREMFPVEHILAGITFMSGTALRGPTVRQGRWGITFLGELSGEITPRLEKICNVFNDAGLETKWSHKIISRLWAKVIAYATLNSLTSVLKVPNGKLLQDEKSIELVKELLAEGEKVAKARGFEPLEGELFELFEEVCKESANNLSSMLQDIINQRPTEIDAQSGALCRYAEKFNLEVPRHHTMLLLVELFEKWRLGTEHF